MIKKIKTNQNPNENLDLPVDFKNMMKNLFLNKRLRLLSIVYEKPKRNPKWILKNLFAVLGLKNL